MIQLHIVDTKKEMNEFLDNFNIILFISIILLKTGMWLWWWWEVRRCGLLLRFDGLYIFIGKHGCSHQESPNQPEYCGKEAKDRMKECIFCFTIFITV